MARLKQARMIQRIQVPVQSAAPAEPEPSHVDPPAEPIVAPSPEPHDPVVPVETGDDQSDDQSEQGDSPVQNPPPAAEDSSEHADPDHDQQQESTDPVGRHELSLDDDPDTSLVPSLLLHLLSEHGVHGAVLMDFDEAQQEHIRQHQNGQQNHKMFDHRFRPGRALAAALHEPHDAPALA